MQIIWRKRASALFLALAASALLLACSQDTSSPTETSVPAKATEGGDSELRTKDQVLAKDSGVTKHAEVEWGWLFEQSGAFAPLGAPAGDGALMAVDEINAAGGFQVGDTIYTIKLDQYDSKSDPTSALAAATELVRDKGVRVLWGPTGPGDAETAALTQREHVLHLCPCPHRELTLLTGEERASSDSHWAFQTAPRQSGLFDILASEIVSAYPDLTRFAGVCSASEIGRGYCDFLRDAFEGAGLEFVGERFVPPEATEFNAVLTDLRSSNPDIVMALLDGGPATFTFLRQATELNVGEMFLVPAVPYSLLEGLAGEGIREKVILAGANPRTELLPTTDEAAAFFENMYKPFAGGSLPLGAGVALTTYDTVYMLVAAMQDAGTVDDVDSIVDALERVHFDGIGEDDLSFDSSHIMVAGADLCTITGGAYQECHHIVGGR